MKTHGAVFFTALTKADDTVAELERLRAENATLRGKIAAVEAERDTARAVAS